MRSSYNYVPNANIGEFYADIKFIPGLCKKGVAISSRRIFLTVGDSVIIYLESWYDIIPDTRVKEKRLILMNAWQAG